MLGQTTTAPPSTADSLAGVSGGAAVWLIVGIAAGLALLWSIPLYLDARRAYKAYKYLQIPLMEKLLTAAEEGKLELSEDQKGELVKAATKRFEATTGLARALMAFAVISILSVALVAVLISDALDAPDLRKTIITALISILGTIVGFYFGARTAEINKQSSRGGPAERERPPGGEKPGQRQDEPDKPRARPRSAAREGSEERDKPG